MEYCGGIAGYYWVLGGVGYLRVMGVLGGNGVTLEYCSVLGYTARYMVLQYPLTCGTLPFSSLHPLYPAVP